jgi:pimeloyl-ACP methyl ester carboxylesterase
MAQLATDATVGVTGIAEGVHRSVWDTVGIPGSQVPGRTSGVTGLVYTAVRGVTRVVGRGVDSALAAFQGRFESTDEDGIGSPRREAILAALNGVLGDRLAATTNPFATPMSLRVQGEALDWQAEPVVSEATSKVVIAIHGLCMNDLQWRATRDGSVVDHGHDVAAALGATTVYVRYNSGLHIWDNGRELADRLEQLIERWPVPIDELVVVAHSMGGLVIRSAIHHGQVAGLSWPSRLTSVVFLATPHHGAPLERAGSWVDKTLNTTPFTAPFAALGMARSVGITDLRHGAVLDDRTMDAAREGSRVVPLPEGVACYAVAATTSGSQRTLANRLLGDDGLVPLDSALGRHADPQRDLGIPPESQWIAYRTSHLQLLSSPEVGRQLLSWLAPS